MSGLPHRLRELALDLRMAGNWGAASRSETLHEAADALSDAASLREQAHRALWLLDDGDVDAARSLLVGLLCSPRQIEIRAAREADAR